MKTENRDKIVAAISTALFFLTVIGLVILHDSNKSLEDLLTGSKLNNEKLLSEKLAIDKDLVKNTKQLNGFKDKNETLSKLLAEANSSILAKELELKRLKNLVAQPALKKELEELRKRKDLLEAELIALNGNYKKMEMENESLSAQLSASNKNYRELQYNHELVKAFATNNYRVEASRGKNDKITVVAKRTKKISLGFELPQQVAENVQFKIRTPDGKVIEKSEDGITARILENEDGSDLMVSLLPMNDIEVSKRIEMKYEPKRKLQKGIYTIDVYNGSTYMVSCQVKLR